VSDILKLMADSFWQILLPGLTTTIPLTLISFGIGMVIALAVAMVRVAKIRVLDQICRFYVWVIRGTPLLVQLFIIYYGLPRIGVMFDAFPAAVIAFSLNEGAYLSETMRASILSVPRGQTEAGYTVGMSYFQVMRRIVLPQAFRVAFPPMFNDLISLTKDTSLAASITVVEMFRSAQKIAARTMEPLIMYIEVAVIYLLFCTVLSRIQVWGEKKLSTYEKRD
jgi:cystine transport system permease protein